jgi:hypothetical protein
LTLVSPTLRGVGVPGFSPHTSKAFLGSGTTGVTVTLSKWHGSKPVSIKKIDIQQSL